MFVPAFEENLVSKIFPPDPDCETEEEMESEPEKDLLPPPFRETPYGHENSAP